MRFNDEAAARRWAAFEQRLAGAVRTLPRAEGSELVREIEGHVSESMASVDRGSEDDRLAIALARLGDPVDFLRPLSTDRLLAKGTRGFRPLALARGLGSMAAEGGRAAVIGLTFLILYSALGTFVAMAVLKPFLPAHVGLYRTSVGQIDFGVVALEPAGQDLLGWATIPVSMALAAATWWLLGRLLSHVRGRAVSTRRVAG